MALKYTGNDPYRMPGLPTLIANFIAEHNYTGDQLERMSGGVVKAPRWGQLARGQRLKTFPDPETLLAIAEVLRLDPVPYFAALPADVVLKRNSTTSR